MKHDGRRYYAEDGNFIFRKADDFLMGDVICMGSEDSIDNYYERPYTEEEYQQFYAQSELDIPIEEDDGV